MSQQQAAQIRQNLPNGGVQLNVANQGLSPFVHSAPGRNLLALPGRNVLIHPTVVTAARTAMNRPSYVNAILIQSRGAPPVARPPRAAVGCTACSVLGTPTGDRKAFPECRHMPGHFGGGCGNCKWQDHAARCSVRDGQEESESSSDDDGSSEESWDGLGEAGSSAGAGTAASSGATASSSSTVAVVVN